MNHMKPHIVFEIVHPGGNLLDAEPLAESRTDHSCYFCTKQVLPGEGVIEDEVGVIHCAHHICIDLHMEDVA